ncbi:uncharacterized protein LOC135840353 [Planococcus citri]|uniref:uncharacterized protein LOC135840353 n=1 Tax=Planococcus citri TaxID=170843 RepID=UPI0031F7C601
MANFHRNSRQTKRDYFGFSFITILCIVSVQVLLCSARPSLEDDASNENPTGQNPTNGVVKSVKELPLMEDEKADDEEAIEGEPEDPEIDEAEESYDTEAEAPTENTPIKKYTEPRETPSTSSSTTPKISHLPGKSEDDENDESPRESNSSTVESPTTDINTNHGLMRKNYCFVLFIPVLSYIFLM